MDTQPTDEHSIDLSGRQSLLLVRHGSHIRRVMRTTMTLTMMTIAGMMALTGDPRWARLQKGSSESDIVQVETRVEHPSISHALLL